MTAKWSDQLNTPRKAHLLDNDTDSLKNMLTRAPLSRVGLVSYLGAAPSGLHLLVSSKDNMTGMVHYPLPQGAYDAEINQKRIDILHQVDAFELPPKSLRDELVDLFFKWVAPIIPVINKTQFMRRYHNIKNPPSLLLQQAVLLAGSKVCTNSQLIDANHPTAPRGLAFYKRAKALYDANYEGNRVIVIQALVLVGWYCAEDITQDAFYWTSLATKRAYSIGMHRNGDNLNKNQKKLWKRIWWTLFTRDRSIAVTRRRPVSISTGDYDVESICKDDFIESDNGVSGDPLHVQFFLQYVKICKITGYVLSQCYSVEGSTEPANPGDCGKALTDWLQNCPPELFWGETKHNFWSALLHGNYYSQIEARKT